MKNQLILFSVFIFFVAGIRSQTYTYCPGDSVYLGLPSYTGSLQWQESPDSINWSNIPGATFSPYGFVFSSNNYYRAKVTSPSCNPVYSPVKRVINGSNCLPPPTFPAGSVFCNGPTAIVDVTNPTTGKTWMDRNLGASQVATNSTDVNAYGDLYQWGRRSDGHQCRTSANTITLSSTDQPGNANFINAQNSPYDWRSPQNVNLWQGVNGVNNPCPSGYRLPTETELTAEHTSWSSQNSTGAFASPLKWPVAGYRNGSSGTLYFVGTDGFYWSSTVSTTNSRGLSFSSSASTGSVNRAYGFSVRCLKETVASVGAINCGGATVTGSVIDGVAASGVTVSVPYTGGNGGFYASQSVASTSVTGLTANLSQGLLASGSGTLTYSVTGTPIGSGTASFTIFVGGQSCTFTVNVQPGYPTGSVFCNGPTLVVEVTNPTTGKIWMDRNLGATQVATSSTDASSYGDLYQWGRGSDGHQCRNSATTSTLSSTDQPGNANFILAPNTPFDWRSPQNVNLWQGVNGVNNPCPSGYRLPTDTELDAERLSWGTNNSAGAFASPLKWPLAGNRNYSNGTLGAVGTGGYYWSSTVGTTNSRYLYFGSSNALMSTNFRAGGYSVRCIKN